MRWFELQRVWRMLPVTALVLAGACGGDDDGGTGPGGGPLAGTYQMVGINEDGLPEEEQMENCTSSLFLGGSLALSENGAWEFAVNLEDETGAHVLRDAGQFQRDGADLLFASAQYGDQFEGEIEDDLVVLYYDFCANGEADIDFVFER
jgi:hypothetical protein